MIFSLENICAKLQDKVNSSQLYIITMDEEEEIHQDGFTIHAMPIWKMLQRPHTAQV